MKRIFLLIMALLQFVIFLNAQKPKNQKASLPVTNVATTGMRDSIPLLSDSTDFVNNNDLASLSQLMKKLMTSDQYRQAGDVISQYELLIGYMNTVILSARGRWERRNAIKVNR